MGNFVTLRLFLFMFCISFPRSGSQIEAVLLLSVQSNIRTAVLIFVVYEYLNTIKSNIRMPIGRKVFK